MAAQVTISQLPQGLPLTGTEAVPVVQNGLTIKTTTQDIANLASGVTNVSSFNTRTGAVTLLATDVTGALGYEPGSVTSVGGTGTVSGLTLSGSVTTTGDLTLGGTLAVTPSDFASQTANTFLAAPGGTAGAPTFRTILAADIPTLNQNTTGTAANVTGIVTFANGGTGQTNRQGAMDALAGSTTAGSYLRGNGSDVVMSAIQAADVPTLNQNTTGTSSNVTGTVAIANGGTGATAAPAARTNLGATTLGGNLFTLANVAAIAFPRINADNTVSSLDAASFRTAIGAGTSSTTGTVTSVATGSGLSGGPITATGTIGLATAYGDTVNPYASKTANTFLSAPNGAAGAPTFRTLVAADVPTLNQNTTGTAANVTGTVAITNGGTGATTLAGASIATYAGAETLTNKRINPRVSTTTSTATLTPDISSFDQYNLTAQAAALTVAAPTGTPVDGNKIMFRFLDNGTARAITWNATYTAIGVTLPTTTVISKMLYVGCIYNAANTRWDVIAVTQQA